MRAPTTSTVTLNALLLQSGSSFVSKISIVSRMSLADYSNNNNNLQAFQLVVLARYLLGVPNYSDICNAGDGMVHCHSRL